MTTSIQNTMEWLSFSTTAKPLLYYNRHVDSVGKVLVVKIGTSSSPPRFTFVKKTLLMHPTCSKNRSRCTTKRSSQHGGKLQWITSITTVFALFFWIPPIPANRRGAQGTVEICRGVVIATGLEQL